MDSGRSYFSIRKRTFVVFLFADSSTISKFPTEARLSSAARGRAIDDETYRYVPENDAPLALISRNGTCWNDIGYGRLAPTHLNSFPLH
jgi:hypothetical protein